MSIQAIRKIVKVGSSDGVTLPTKELKQNGLKRGDEVEIVVRAGQKRSNAADQVVIDAAKDILNEYQQDFKNLAKR